MGKNRRRRTEAEAEAALTEKAFMMRKVQRWDGIRTSPSLNRSKPQLGLGWSSLDATGVSPTLDPGPLEVPSNLKPSMIFRPGQQ